MTDLTNINLEEEIEKLSKISDIQVENIKFVTLSSGKEFIAEMIVGTMDMEDVDMSDIDDSLEEDELEELIELEEEFSSTYHINEDTFFFPLRMAEDHYILEDGSMDTRKHLDIYNIYSSDPFVNINRVTIQSKENPPLDVVYEYLMGVNAVYFSKDIESVKDIVLTPKVNGNVIDFIAYKHKIQQ